jgi:hypothetical protein
MLLTLIRSYVTWLLISVAVCALGTTLSALLVHPAQGREFLVSYVYSWDGLVVATAGFGALQFALSTYKQQFHYLTSEILQLDRTVVGPIYFELEKLYSIRNKQVIALPVLLVGSVTLYICGYPMTGLPQSLLWLSSSTMYYAGGLMLAYTVYSVRFFATLERYVDYIQLKNNVHILEFENFNLYLSTLFLTATVALYFAFRGTLTANFTFTPPFRWVGQLVQLVIPPTGNYKLVRNLLIYPIILFLPYAAFSGFYIRLVLRKIYLVSIKRKIMEIDELANPAVERAEAAHAEDRIIDIRNAAMDLKDKIIKNNKVLPLIDIKDSPSIVLLMIIVIQFVVHNDDKIRDYLGALFGVR